MRIVIASDHGGFELKEQLIPFIEGLGHSVENFGCYDTASVDYSDYGIKVGEAVAKGDFDRGIVICGTGIGISIAANKVKGAYAALVNNVYQAQRAALSNNANIITMGAQVTGIEVAKMMVDEYLGNTFDPQSRSMPKVARITEYDLEGK